MGPLDRLPGENEEIYYRRIFRRKPIETDTEFERRVTIIKKYLPELRVWKNDVYKRYVTVVEVTKEQPTTETEITETTKRTVTRSATPLTTEVSFSFLFTILDTFHT